MIHGAYPSHKLDRDSEFFHDFPDNGIFHAFTGFDFSTGQPPMIRFGASLPLDQKDPGLVDDRGAAAQAWNGLVVAFEVVTHSGVPKTCVIVADANPILWLTEPAQSTGADMIFAEICQAATHSTA